MKTLKKWLSRIPWAIASLMLVGYLLHGFGVLGKGDVWLILAGLYLPGYVIAQNAYGKLTKSNDPLKSAISSFVFFVAYMIPGALFAIGFMKFTLWHLYFIPFYVGIYTMGRYEKKYEIKEVR